MAAIVSTVAYLGLEARAVEVQVQLIPGLPAFNLVGLKTMWKSGIACPTFTRTRRVRTSSPSLRAQLDAARRDKQIAERRLEQSQTYTYRLMETISRLRTELQLEKDRVSELEAEVAGGDDGDALFFGTDDVPGFPPMPAKKKAGRARSRSHS